MIQDQHIIADLDQQPALPGMPSTVPHSEKLVSVYALTYLLQVFLL